jgi:hypothetical protein
VRCRRIWTGIGDVFLAVYRDGATPPCIRSVCARLLGAISLFTYNCTITSSMSQTTHSDIDFWEFVACSRCHLQFISEPGRPPQVPFWLTECGHVVCNNHLSELVFVLQRSVFLTRKRDADQSCAQCGAQSIQLVPLQREVRFSLLTRRVFFSVCIERWTRRCQIGLTQSPTPWIISRVPLRCAQGFFDAQYRLIAF